MRWTATDDGDPGLDVVIVDGDDPDGTDVLERHVTLRSSLNWDASARTTPWSARLTATLTPPVTGRYVFQGASTERFRIFVDDELVIDGWDHGDAGRGRRVEGGMHLVAGGSYGLRAEMVARAGTRSGLQIRGQAPLADDAFERAVATAQRADAAVVVVGTNSDWETEGRDRRTMDLPGRQVELVRAVAAVNPRTIVIVNAGAPVTMDWVDDVPAVLQSWFLGQETGNAIADVLTGAVDASGRLPTTIPKRIEDTPAFLNYPGEFGAVVYGEGLFVGYRWYDARGIEPRFAFGHGLSYTTFEHSSLAVTVDASGDSATVRLAVANTGERAGVETVQVYVRDVESSVQRPVKELAGFAKVALDPGESREVVIGLDRSAFAFWHPGEHGWRVEPGEFEILVGSSAAAIHQTATVTIGERSA